MLYISPYSAFYESGAWFGICHAVIEQCKYINNMSENQQNAIIIQIKRVYFVGNLSNTRCKKCTTNITNIYFILAIRSHDNGEVFVQYFYFVTVFANIYICTIYI